MALSRPMTALLLAASLLGAAQNIQAEESAPRNLIAEEANRTLVLEFYDRFFNRHDVAGAAAVVAENYKQHNPQVPDGKAPFVNFFIDYFKDNPESHVRVVRSATDGDLVFLHVHASNGANDRGQAVVDIFRVEKGMIVQHWDVIQDVPEQSANDNTMF